jgi:hypothetical protein
MTHDGREDEEIEKDEADADGEGDGEGGCVVILPHTNPTYLLTTSKSIYIYTN